MKKLSIISIAAFTLLFASSCKKYMAINTNPNNATTATPEAILPQAIVGTAANLSSYNNYGAELVGYAANAGGYGGFGSNWTYDFGPNDYSGLWSSTYNTLQDFQAVITYSATDSTHSLYNAIARIMKAYNYQLLVDTYNNVPYSQALQGANDATPKYDDAKTIYPQLAAQLDSAIAIINGAASSQLVPTPGTDPLFGGDMNLWVQFANTLKLRMILRASGAVTFQNTNFDAAGFLTTDAICNPGYAKVNGQQNPSWNYWVQNYAGTVGQRAWMPNTYAFAYYDGEKLLDTFRGPAIYYQFPNTPNNQLGVGTTAVPSAPSTTNAWYSGSTTSLGNATGVMKGYNMGQPVMLAAESYFLQAEAQLRGIITSSNVLDSNFYWGIKASFRYISELPDDKTLGTDWDGNPLNPATNMAQYIADNNTLYQVNFSLATTPAQQLEAIITQKYIALNMINSQEAWNEYRRTGYPVCSQFTTDATQSFASVLSQSSRPDHLPTRILYPASEYSYNAANVPSGISPYTSLIFWAK